MTNTLPQYLQDLQHPLPGEAPGEHLKRIALAFEGCSLDHNRDKLNEMFLTNEPTPQAAANTAMVSTSCGTSARAIYSIAQCPNTYITRPYEIGQAISELIQAATQMGALINCRNNPDAWKLVDVGTLIHYSHPSVNDDHVEFCISKPDENGMAQHIGGGRARNCYGPMETGSIKTSLGRPIAHIIDPNKMGLPTLPSLPVPQPDPVIPTPNPTQPDPQPTPDPTPAPIQPVSNQTSFLDTIIQLVVKLVQWFLSFKPSK